MNCIKSILTSEFFNTYYVQKKMNYNQIANMLHRRGHHISLSSVKKYGRRFGVGRSRSECKRFLDWNISFFSEKIAEIVDGLVLSDASVTPQGQVVATLRHEEFRDYWSSLLSPYVPVNLTCYPNKGDKPYFRFCTKTHVDFQQQRKRWYPNGIKKIPEDVKLTPLSVLMWYLGDGYFDLKCRHIYLHTNSFCPTDVKNVVDRLNDLGVLCKFSWRRKQGTYKRDYPVIHVSYKNIPSFFEFIGFKSPVKCYDYKFNIPEWLPGSLRISQISNIHRIPQSKVRWVVQKLENSGSPHVKRITPKGRIWVLKSGILKVIKQCN